MKGYLQFIILLSAFDPYLSLTLRVDKQWESCRSCDDNTILNRQLVIRQTLQIPFSDRRIVDQHTDQIDILGKTENSLGTASVIEVTYVFLTGGVGSIPLWLVIELFPATSEHYICIYADYGMVAVFSFWC